MLYAQFQQQIQNEKASTQQLLFPEIITLDSEQIILFEQLLDELRIIGFEVEQFTPNSYSIHGVPSQVVNQSPVQVLQDIMTAVRERSADTQSEWRNTIITSLAEKAAIPSGKTLTIDEMRDLVKRLFQLDQTLRTPNGSKILHLLTDEDIHKLF